MNAPLTWPVYGHDPREDIAWFFEWGDAASFAMRPTDFGAEQRNLYVGQPKRVTPAVKIEEKRLPNGWNRWAA
jgi:hypothetical protein